MKFVHVLMVLGCACALPTVSSAQWQWVDNSGKKVFSDQPPPIDIPEKNILRRAGGAASRGANVQAPTAAPATDAAAAPAAPAGQPAAAAPKPAGVDKELEEKARQAEAAEKAKQAAEAQKNAKLKADNCAQARQSKATFDSGIRVARVNAQGEREVMDDKARAAEAQRAQAAIDNNCK